MRARSARPTSKSISSRGRCWRPRNAGRRRHRDQRREPLSGRDRAAWPAMPAPCRWRCARMRWRRRPNACWRSKRARARDPDWSARSGGSRRWPGAVNVIPGQARFTIDLRSPDDAQRMRAADDVLRQASRRSPRGAASTVAVAQNLREAGGALRARLMARGSTARDRARKASAVPAAERRRP